MRMLWVVVVAACGGGSTRPDAAMEIDAAVDAPISVDAADPGANVTHRYVLSRVQVPTTNAQARDLGLDLDGDGVVDNQLGQVMSALTGQGFDVQAPMDAAITRGRSITLATLTLTTSNSAVYAHLAGANPNPAPCNGAGDTTCGRHLQGTATFDVAPGSPMPPALAGMIAGTAVTAGPGTLHVPFLLWGDTPVVLGLIGARVKLASATGAGVTGGVIAGAVTTTEVDEKIYPNLHAGVAAAIAADCTNPQAADCGCATGSSGRTFVNLFDTNPRDCTVTLNEIKTNSLIQSLLAPDVTINGQSALSLGYGVTAVPATFTP